MLKADITALLPQIPGKPNPVFPEGVRFIEAMRHGTMSVEIYAPRGHDPQQPHAQDELYIIQSGSGTFVLDEEPCAFQPGMVFFVPAGHAHHFENMSDDFVTWVIFWGPKGGEAP